MNDKIKELLSIKNLTPSRFADEIGVQRSSISHILSGRNKPSLEIIQKIMRRFPELGTDWFLEEGTTLKSPANERRFVMPEKVEVASAMLPNQSASREEADKHGADFSYPKSAKRIERILVFYSDNTFNEFTPNDLSKG